MLRGCVGAKHATRLGDSSASFEALLARLRPRAAAFVREYIVGLNATKAAIRAGYSPKTAHARAWKLKQQRVVRAAINAGLAIEEAKRALTSLQRRAHLNAGVGRRSVMAQIMARVEGDMAREEQRRIVERLTQSLRSDRD
jgi:phage terminase small subunit